MQWLAYLAIFLLIPAQGVVSAVLEEGHAHFLSHWLKLVAVVSRQVLGENDAGRLIRVLLGVLT